MKINIWIKTEEAIGGTITKYYTTEPVSNLKDPDKHKTEWVQVQVTQDEFAKLEEKIVDENMERNKLEDKIYEESQNITGGDFEKWYKGLTPEERFAYKTVYGN
tara:strand:- start:263 stop:574 length:312 start_codon:yes stop_codon:yes gene_type:complete